MKKLNFKMNKIAALVASGVLVSAAMTSVQANTPVNATASVVVNGAITVVRVNHLSFGEIVALAHTADQATLSLSPLEGAATPGTVTNDGASIITKLGEGAPAKFTITGIGSNADVIITTNLGEAGGLQALTNGAVPGADPIAIASPTIYSVTESTFRSFTAGVSNALTTDGDGNLEFNVGATITLPTVTPAGNLPDGTYSGSFTVVANYQ